MSNTLLNYLQDSNQFAGEAEVLWVSKDELERDLVVLNQTILYPQGGGQPCDKGKITGINGVMVVTDVRLVGESVYHYGSFNNSAIKAGERVMIEIDEARRRLNTRNHSAGHLLDVVLHEIKPDLIPVKGFHFPEGPYVEYSGVLPEHTETLAQKLEEKINQYTQAGFEVITETVLNRDELTKKCNFVPEYLPDNKPIRIVTLFGDKGTPCGGTHVKNIKQIGAVEVTKIKNKDGHIRISYRLKE